MVNGLFTQYELIIFSQSSGVMSFWVHVDEKVLIKSRIFLCTVLPAKRDSDVIFCLQRIRDLESLDHLCINAICRIGSIHK